MVHRIVTTTCAGLLLLATAASAQGGAYTGTVSHIDASTSTIYFTDGRILHLDPGATITVDGRAITLEQLPPGMTVQVDRHHPGLVSRPDAGGAAQAGGPRSDQVSMVPGHPPVNVTGTVAQLDAERGTVTFQDGRTVKITPQSRTWTPSATPPRPGEQVMLRNVQPLRFGAAAGARHRAGTVATTDPTRREVLLTDGTLVQLGPGGRVHFDGRQISISELRPGDEVVIAVREPADASQTTPPAASPGAMPRDAFARITVDASDVQVLFRHQAGG